MDRRKLLFAIITVITFFGAAEGIARVFVAPPDPQLHRQHSQIIQTLGLPALNDTMIADPILFWRLRPGLNHKRIEGRIRESAIDFTLSTTNEGMRGTAPSERAPAYRVLALGDSTTFGLGVNDEETWPAVLERMLREKTGRDVQVLNAGVPGYSAFQGLRYLREQGLSVHPDLVVATFGFNDADSWSARSDIETSRALAIQGWEAPLLHSRLYTGLKGLVPAANPPPSTEAKRPRLSPREFYDTLSAIRDECASRSVSLVLVVWPYAAQKNSGDGRLILAQPVMTAFGSKNSVPVVNLVNTFTASTERLFLDHVHANAAGCRRAAEALLPVCLEQIGKKTKS
jgi:lysophospholipase L1-like esterase